MGREGSLYEIAQWYPRMAVYDDVHGWNTDQYLGQGEFYLEYGDIDYEVTLPAGYIVAGSGRAAEPGAGADPGRSAPGSRPRSSPTARSPSSPPTELTSGAARPTREGTLTWRFRAEQVRDVAWAASPEYHVGRVRLGRHPGPGVLPARPRADLWQDAAKMSRVFDPGIQHPLVPVSVPADLRRRGAGVRAWSIPWSRWRPTATTRPSLYNVITHEIGHMWYPMTVGSDERRYAWMDEGFNTFINTFSEEDYWKRDDSQTRLSEAHFVTALDQTPTAQPIMTPANRYRNNDNLGALAYVKPSIMLLTLRNKVLGPEVFDTAFREYTRRWAFKHPQPSDFFRTIEEVSGRDLAWFWRGFFYTTAALDQAVEGVKPAPDGSALVTLRSLGSAVMPVELELDFTDGTNADGEAAGGDLVRRESLRISGRARQDDRERARQPGRNVPRRRSGQRRVDRGAGHDALTRPPFAAPPGCDLPPAPAGP